MWGRSSRGRAVAACALVAWALAGTARAEPECPGDAAPIAAVPVEARTAFLRDQLAEAYGPARRWSITWGVIDGALVVGQLAAIPFNQDRATRALLAAGAASGALAFVQLLFFPVAVSPPPPRPGADPCAVVGELERLLELGARNQALGSGPIAHASNALINAGLGIGAGFAGRSVATGVLTFAIGLGIGEAQILTQPTDLVHARDRYRAADLAPFALAPTVGLGPAGALSFGLAGRF